LPTPWYAKRMRVNEQGLPLIGYTDIPTYPAMRKLSMLLRPLAILIQDLYARRQILEWRNKVSA
jgi:hypothetical protein